MEFYDNTIVQDHDPLPSAWRTQALPHHVKPEYLRACSYQRRLLLTRKPNSPSSHFDSSSKFDCSAVTALDDMAWKEFGAKDAMGPPSYSNVLDPATSRDICFASVGNCQLSIFTPEYPSSVGRCASTCGI